MNPTSQDAPYLLMKNKDNKVKRFLVPIWSEALGAMSLGWDLAIPIFGGVLLGHYLDKWLGTTYEFTIGLLVMGIAVSYYNLGRFIQKNTEKNKRKTEENDKGVER